MTWGPAAEILSVLHAKDLAALSLDGAWRMVFRSQPQHLLLPDQFSRARQERGVQTGANKTLPERLNLRRSRNEIHWFYKA